MLSPADISRGMRNVSDKELFTGYLQNVAPSGQPSPEGRAGGQALRGKRQQGQKWGHWGLDQRTGLADQEASGRNCKMLSGQNDKPSDGWCFQPELHPLVTELCPLVTELCPLAAQQPWEVTKTPAAQATKRKVW